MIDNLLITNDLKELSEQISKTDKIEQLYWIHGFVSGLIQNRQGHAPIALPNGNGHKVESTSVKESKSLCTILYGTQSGNSKKIAQQLFEKARENGLNLKFQDMGEYDPRHLKNEEQILLIVSTHGEGEPPLAAEGLLEYLLSKKAPKLDHLKYAVLALGDKSYVNFCKTGADFDQQLGLLGAQRIRERVDCDVDFQSLAEKWIDELVEKLGKGTASIKLPNEASAAIVQKKSNVFTRENPGRLLVTEAVNLNGRGSGKQTIHLELQAEDLGLEYAPGDSLGIYFENPVNLVEDVLSQLKMTGEEQIVWQNTSLSVKDFLLKKAELIQINRDVIENYLKIKSNTELEEILKEPAKLSAFIYGRDVLDLLQEYPVTLAAQELTTILRPMQARLYSIASSPLYAPGEVHITVDILKYEYRNRSKSGACSGYISSGLEVGGYVTAFISANEGFRLPGSDKDIIMIGPGTGVAPFRSFIQHREANNDPGRNWLFFGSRNFETDFLYQTEWQKYQKDKLLHRIDLAFSRDQEEKIYVQHRLQQRSKEIYSWLENGAHIYVCGDKSSMAKDVFATLTEIVKKEGGFTDEDALGYVKNLRKQRRYLEDVY